jgi:3-deoxy-7-phosphoheptulonate synthase
VAGAIEALRKAALPIRLVVDCSHANCGKKQQYQQRAWHSVIEQRVAGNADIVGLMLESNLFEGNQPFQSDPSKLRYGVSITDECIGWEKTAELLRQGHGALREVLGSGPDPGRPAKPPSAD